jgi:cytochrome b
MQRTLVWDFPTRLFHWLLAVGFALAWLSSASDRWLSHHVFLGYALLGLLGFRLLWGVVGGHYARFAAFRFGPRAGLAYLRETLSGSAARHIGHNPAGSQAIYLLLLLLLLIGVSGIFTLGGEEQHGMAAGWPGLATGRVFKKIHEASATLMLLVVGAHIAAVLLESLLHRENLALSMLTGTKLAARGTAASKPYRTVAALMLLALSAFGGWWFSYALAPAAPGKGPLVERAAVAFVGASLAQNALWNEECGSCHLSFHPSLLPARSWQQLLAQQGRHFGADLAPDSATTATLLGYAMNNAADKRRTEAAFKIDSSVPVTAAPLRITETPYWLKKHRDIAAADWTLPWIKSKSNCEACHLDAQSGTFEDAAMRIPRSAPATKQL